MTQNFIICANQFLKDTYLGMYSIHKRGSVYFLTYNVVHKDIHRYSEESFQEIEEAFNSMRTNADGSFVWQTLLMKIVES